MTLTKCLRCSGILIYENFYAAGEEFWGWKCLICGDIVDSVILENRKLTITGQGIDVRRKKG